MKTKQMSKIISVDDDANNQIDVEQSTEMSIDDAETVDEQSTILYKIPQVNKEKYEYKPIVSREITYMTDSNRISSEVMTSFEYSYIISIRAKQIENGGPVFVEANNIIDPIKIAKKEIEEKKNPLKIIRMITSNIAEVWRVNEMAIPYE